jgi:putative alpha-1,2-mannosidase
MEIRETHSREYQSASDDLVDLVDPFIGTQPVDLPPQTGIAATWFWPKPHIGNTHPGACLPFGMVSVMPYSGGYPTGYGCYGKSLEGYPPRVMQALQVSGFTHFQQTGVGAIRKYSNYCRVTPFTEECGGLSSVGMLFPITSEEAAPGFYTCVIQPHGIRAEITVTPRGAIHRYTFPKSNASGLAVDFSHGGINIEDGRTIPLRAECALQGTRGAEACVTMEGLPIRMSLEVSGFDVHPAVGSLWENGELLSGEREKAYEYMRESTYVPFGVAFCGPTEEGQVVELKVAFSFRSRKKAYENRLSAAQDFSAAKCRAKKSWEKGLGQIQIQGGTQAQQRTFYTALYHSLIKPSEAQNESPFWPWDGPFFFDFSTLWDMYKTQLPLVLTLFPDQGAEIVNALLTVVEMEGNFPIGYRLARGHDRFSHQASALGHVVIADAFHRRLPGIDWERAVTMMTKDLGRAYGEAFFQDGIVHPITHTLDLAYGCFCTALVAHEVGDAAASSRMLEYATQWKNAFDQSGILRESTYYEGSKYNYSFRLLHDMASRIKLAGGDTSFVNMLDTFFGYDAAPVQQPGVFPCREQMVKGESLGRFEGLNNEPDMESPYAYIYAGRHDKACEVIRAGLTQCYGDTPGGMVGNDDSGGMSSWYVWSALGIFPVAGQDVFLLGAPLFDRAQIQCGQSCPPLVIEAVGGGDGRHYVQGVSLNGVPHQRPYLCWKEMASGGILLFEMTSTPTVWTHERPPSYA